MGRNGDSLKKDGPVSGVENGPSCFMRDLGLGGKIKRTGRETENRAEHCNL